MGPIFYLVRSHGGVRDPISAVVLADWPRESFPRPTHARSRPGTSAWALGPPVRRGLRRSEKKLGGKFAPSGRCALLLCAARWWIFCEDRFGK